MIIAWVLSLLLLMASLVGYLQRVTALEIIASQTLRATQAQWIQAEKNLLECEEHLSHLTELSSGKCVVQSTGKQLWKLTTLGGPILESVVYLDESSRVVTRLSWRQAFKE